MASCLVSHIETALAGGDDFDFVGGKRIRGAHRAAALARTPPPSGAIPGRASKCRFTENRARLSADIACRVTAWRTCPFESSLQTSSPIGLACALLNDRRGKGTVYCLTSTTAEVATRLRSLFLRVYSSFVPAEYH